MMKNAEAGAHSNILRKVESLFMIVQFQVLECHGSELYKLEGRDT